MVAQSNVGGGMVKNDFSKPQVDGSFKEIIEDYVCFFSLPSSSPILPNALFELRLNFFISLQLNFMKNRTS